MDLLAGGRSASRVAIVAAIAVAMLYSGYRAMAAPPFIWPDEMAHTGYLVTLADGRLPTLDTPIKQIDDQTNLDVALSRARPAADGTQPRTSVWVANHPPGSYVLALPGAVVAKSLGDTNQVLGWQRIANVIAAGLVVGLTALLARELTGSPIAGAVAAGIVALLPSVSGVLSQGMTDGIGLATLLAAVWLATRAIERRFDRSSTIAVAIAVSACGMVRLTSLLAALAVTAVALIISSSRSRRVLWKPAVAIGLATAVTSGWFYVRNVVLYGDPGASSELLSRMDRSPQGSGLEIATTWSMWRDVLHKLFTGNGGGTATPVWPHRAPHPVVGDLFLLAVVLLAAFVLVSHLRSTRAPDADVRGPRPGASWGWLLLVVAGLTTFATTVQHVSGGGLPHARYLLVLIPLVACLVGSAAATLARSGGPRALVGLVPALAVLYIHHLALPEWRGSVNDEGRYLLTGFRYFPTGFTDLQKTAVLALAGIALLIYFVATGIGLMARPRTRRAPLTID